MSTILIGLEERLSEHLQEARGVEQAFLKHFSAEVVRGAVELPPMPEVMLELDRLLRDPDVSIRRVAQAVRAEPVATPRLIGLANSVMFAGLGRVATVENAIARLGLHETKLVVQALALSSRLTRVPGWEPEVEAIYEHSIAAACAAYVLAERDAAAADEHFLAALVHDIGRSVVLASVGDFERSIRRRGAVPRAFVQSLMSILHAELSALTLERWNGAPMSVVAVRYHQSPELVGPIQTRVMAHRLAIADDLARYALDPAVSAEGLARVVSPASLEALAISEADRDDIAKDMMQRCRAFGLPTVAELVSDPPLPRSA